MKAKPVGVFCTWDATNGLQSSGECNNGLTECASLSKEREDNQKAEDEGTNARRSCALNGIKKGWAKSYIDQVIFKENWKTKNQ